ncbi:HAD family hydrolase [Dethiosulfovibrio peptidovorans]|uniref:HAD family hydrolase n=1 Tax=Dethiosulfovibrio peptidovorans TaxID=47055 RepID=UPI00030F77A4|nr:HAD family hydrolase [Dethiosulfovibrio peptidovorans]
MIFLIEVVLFDFDMTLVDSSQGITDCMNAVAENMGLPKVTREQVLGIIGIPLAKGLHSLWGEYDENCLSEYRRIFSETEYAGIVPFPETIPAIEKLRAMNLRVGVATNRHVAEPVVKAVGLFDRFDLVMGLGDLYRPKPEPDMILAAMKELGGSPDGTLYVGDTDIDMRTTVAAGMKGVGLASGTFSREDLEVAGAWRTLDGIGDLPELLEEEGLICLGRDTTI